MSLRRLNLTYVYIDIYFLNDILADITVLMLFCLIINSRIYIGRIVIAALIGSSYSVFSIIEPHNIVIIHLLGILIAYIMLRLTLKNPCIVMSEYIRYILILYLIGFMKGGIIYYVSPNDNSIAIHILITSVLVFIVLVTAGNKGLKRYRYLNSACCEVAIVSGSRRYCGRGFYDSGNGMYEPISGSMVIIGDVNRLDSFLTEGEKNYIRLFPELPDTWDGVTYVRGIPYSALGTSKGMLPAIRLDEVAITRDNVITRYNNCYIGISTGALSMEDRYDFILHRDMI